MWISRDVVEMNKDREDYPRFLQQSDHDRYSVEYNVFAIRFHVGSSHIQETEHSASCDSTIIIPYSITVSNTQVRQPTN